MSRDNIPPVTIDEDNRVRVELAADGSRFQGYTERMAEVHNCNTAEPTAFID